MAMVSNTTFLQVQVWGLFLETAAFGIYLVTCGACYRAVFMPRAHHGQCGMLDPATWPVLVVFLILLAKAASSAVLHLVLNLRMVSAADRAAAVTMFLNGSNALNNSKYTTILVEAVIGSGFLLYRCWLFYRSWRLLVAPCVLWLAGVALMGAIIGIDNIKAIDGVFDAQRIVETCFWGIIFGVNLLATSLIARRVWRTDYLKNRTNNEDLDDTVMPVKKERAGLLNTTQVSRVIIESGMLYTLLSLISFVLFAVQTVAVYAALDVLVQVIAITVNLIIMRSGRRPRMPSSAASYYEAHMNNYPLQLSSEHTNTASVSGTGSAIEFAFPKYFNPRSRPGPGAEKTVALPAHAQPPAGEVEEISVREQEDG